MIPYERLADAIVELQAATDAEMASRGVLKGYDHIAVVERLLVARRTITQLAKEIACPSPQ